MNLFRGISHALAALFNNRAEFHRRWKHYRHAPDSDPMEGKWQGEWVSEANGHRGALKCLLTRGADGEFEASFHAVYARFLTVCYTVRLRSEGTGGKLRLKGQADLGGLAGGIYHYEGKASPDKFECSYRCKYDHGIFHLAPLRR